MTTKLKKPTLIELTIEAVERFDKEYSQYVLEHELQATFGKRPLAQELLIDPPIKDNMAMRLGITADRLTTEMIKGILEKFRTMSKKSTSVMMKEEEIFRGLKMRSVRREHEVEQRSSEYINSISTRISKYPGLLQRFHDEKERELRKQSFPVLFDGIALEGVRTEMKRLWKQSGKRWSLVKFIEELEQTMTTFGGFEVRMKEAKATSAEQPASRDRDNRDQRAETRKRILRLRCQKRHFSRKIDSNSNRILEIVYR